MVSGLAVVLAAPCSAGAALLGAATMLWRRLAQEKARRCAWQSSLAQPEADRAVQQQQQQQQQQQLRAVPRAARALVDLTRTLTTLPPALLRTSHVQSAAADPIADQAPSVASAPHCVASAETQQSSEGRGTKRSTSPARAPTPNKKHPRTAAQEARDAALLALPLPTHRLEPSAVAPSPTSPAPALALAAATSPVSLAMSSRRKSWRSERWGEAEFELAAAMAQGKRKDPYVSRLAAAEWEAEQRVKKLLATLPTVRAFQCTHLSWHLLSQTSELTSMSCFHAHCICLRGSPRINQKKTSAAFP